ncbi:hypothetical protein LH413_14015 [Yersinia massiliensis]|uniref:hypothetical protein n=1 Tax=Yersinia massiliensis TaxID=419257 RepID=UPI001CFE8B15|nr:hypothetical protein [Yersinia massiliensis]MCB5318608.1 hypothetical protein [Yersinia massiliensis]
MEHNKSNIKPMSYRMRPEVRDFVERNASKTYRSAQGMMDYLMDRVIEMEKKGDFVIQ